ncbi:MAG: DUF2950 domain-containing protein, partial [Candidatus Solibacter sp.]|nr:DUF2950 domain-containing protein [Candidatus Solibacter sp.]
PLNHIPAANRLPWLAGKATCAHQLNAGQASNEITELRPSFLRQKVVSRFQMVALATLALCLFPVGLASAAEQKTFPTPNAAMTALIAAVKAHTPEQVMAILGPELEAFNATRDKAQDEMDRQLFLEGSRIVKLEKQGDDPNTVIAYLGEIEWPFPAPLVKTSTGWKFDGKAAVEESKDREIGRNELAAIDACQAYVDVQLDYFSSDRQGDGYLQFAQKINSTPGKFDGLYWSNASGEDVSPLGPFAAEAAGAESDLSVKPLPLSGYYFKILTAQGDAAAGGARSYLVNGRMLAGFALVAWPAEYGVTGGSTFLVNQQGIVYQKDLGPDTEQIARTMSQFNPDSTWTKTE